MMMRERSCAGAVMVHPTSDRALHYLMLCGLLRPDHHEPQKHIKETAADVLTTQRQSAG